MNLPLGFAQNGVLRQPPGHSNEKGSNASWICGRQQRRNRGERCRRPYAQSYMYATLRGRLLVGRSLSANSPPADRSATLARTERAAAASECRRQVRPAAPRRSARARQRQDDVITLAGPTDTTAAPSRAASCACVAGVVSLSTEQDDCSYYRARDTLLSERAR